MVKFRPPVDQKHTHTHTKNDSVKVIFILEDATALINSAACIYIFQSMQQ